MRYGLLAAAAIAVAAPSVAFAQDMGAQDTGYETTASDTAADAPDGTPAFGIEPYVGVLGGYEFFDSEDTDSGLPRFPNDNLEGSLVQGVAGVNVPLGPVFIGVEGNAAKGISGDIDWQYGGAGRVGFRAGDSGLFYGKVGYQWVNFDRLGEDSRDFHDMTYGIGVEVGPKDIGLGGLTGNSGVRLRLEANTYGDFNSFRPMAGLIAHF